MRLARFGNGSLEYFVNQPIRLLLDWAAIARRIAQEEKNAARK
jgi:hypothetical protein